jgi:hypothetical protein
MAKYSSTPIFNSMSKSKEWKFLGQKRLFGKMKKGRIMSRTGGFREQGVKTYHFEFVGLNPYI